MVKGKDLRPLIYLGITIVALMLLAASLANLELLPGRAVSLWGNGPAQPQTRPAFGIDSDQMAILWRVLTLIVLILLPISLLYLIVSPQARKQLLRDLAVLLPFILMLYYLLSVIREGELKQPQEQPLEEMFPPLTGGSTPEVVADYVTNPPIWLLLVTSLVLALAAAGVFMLVARSVWNRRHPAGPLEQLAQEAETALAALRTGADLRNTIIRCYYEMTQVLSEQRGIQRQATMTPREFEAHLQELGLPGEPVRRLTRLFEKARYGNIPTGQADEQQAIHCLQFIVAAIRRTA